VIVDDGTTIVASVIALIFRDASAAPR